MKKQKDSGGWICEFGCDQAAYLKKSGTGCPHLEALIGSPRAGEFRPDRLEEKQTYDHILTPDEEFQKKVLLEESGGDEVLLDEELNLRYNLKRLGLAPKSLEVVVLRLVRGYTFKEISDELKYKDRSGAHIAYRRAIDKLKLNGYGRG